MEVPLYCLICNQLIICGDGEDDKKKCLPLQLGLQLFYKLLKNNVNTIKSSFYFEQAVGKMSSCLSPPPCCEECGLVFEEMVRLQQSIEEIQMSLLEQVEKLKGSLLTSIPADYQKDPLKIPDLDNVEQIREQLLSSVRETVISTSSIHPVRQAKRNISSITRRKRHHPEILKQAIAVPPKKLKEYQSCSVLLERIPLTTLQTSRVTLSKPTIKTDVEIDKEASEADSDPEFVPSPQTGSNHNYGSDDNDDDYPWESEAPPINEEIQIKQEKYNSSLSPIKPPPRKYSCTKFSIITPDTLLYQFTLIKVSQGYSVFTCQEPGCPSPIYSDSSLNWSNLFTQLAHHIESSHSNFKSGPRQLAPRRQCPLCQIEVNAGPSFRHHLTGSKGHSIEMVACEICLKPIKNVTDYYRNHQWHHKSDQEKRDCEEGPPSKFRRSAKQMLILNCTPKLKENIPKPETKCFIPEISCEAWGPKPSKLLVKKFSIIFPDTLLFYQTTLIKVSPGYTQLTCQEPECPSPIFSTEAPLNWYSLFLQMAEHIDSTHDNDQANCYLRPCPLCGIKLQGRELRAHLTGKFGVHRVEQVICEICLNTVRNVSDYYRVHQWRHKNVEDKMNSLEGPPSKIRNKTKSKSQIESQEVISIPPRPPPPVPLKVIKLFGVQKFWIISPDTLLYQHTLIKVAQGHSQLICQELQCPSPMFSCEDPSNWKSLFDQMVEHINSTHCKLDPNGRRICPVCGIHVKGKDFRAHLIGKQSALSVHRIGEVACEICWKPVRKEYYRNHQWHHKNELEKEQNCEDDDERPRKLVKKPFSCETCGKAFKGRALLGYHQALHLPKEMRKHYKCPQCPRMFLNAVGVRGHVERVHQRELMRYRQCPICNKQYNWRNGYKFKSHLRSHRNERPFVCETCGLAFLDTTGLKCHRERVHEGKGEGRPWQCEFCEMNYKARSGLRRHRRLAHKEEVEGEMTEEERLKLTNWEYRPDFIGPRIAFPCPACEKVFPLRSRMKKHFDKYCKAKQ